ncbi:MAG: hypothetical protein HKN08_06700 [Gammaproteobacteria bacterium]|nr:hypothetical protein [Gammaproteobacteria bacterium]
MSFHNPDAENNLKIMVFGSSSTLNTIKFLNHDFKKIIFYWSGNFDFSAIDEFKPDILINQIRERHLIRPADDTVGFTTTEMAFVKSYYKIGDNISPIPFNQRSTIANCLAKIGNKSNQTYQKHLKKLCEKLGVGPIYKFALNINRKKYSFKKIRILVFFKLLFNQFVSGGITSRLNRLIAHID